MPVVLHGLDAMLCSNKSRLVLHSAAPDRRSAPPRGESCMVSMSSSVAVASSFCIARWDLAQEAPWYGVEMRKPLRICPYANCISLRLLCHRRTTTFLLGAERPAFEDSVFRDVTLKAASRCQQAHLSSDQCASRSERCTPSARTHRRQLPTYS